MKSLFLTLLCQCLVDFQAVGLYLKALFTPKPVLTSEELSLFSHTKSSSQGMIWQKEACGLGCGASVRTSACDLLMRDRNSSSFSHLENKPSFVHWVKLKSKKQQ